MASPYYASDRRINCVAWGSTNRKLWWPVYLCDPKTIAEDLHVLGSAHNQLLERRRHPNFPLVYYLGTYEFEGGFVNVKDWFCDEYKTFSQEPDIPDDKLREWCLAFQEAQKIRVNGIVPYLTPSDLNKNLPPMPPPPIVPEGSIMWHYSRGNPWMPCYVLEPSTVIVTDAPTSIRSAVRQAQKTPDKYYLVYFFGIHSLKLFVRSWARVKLWECPEHDGFLRGIPRLAHFQQTIEKAVKHAMVFVVSGYNVDHLTFPGLIFTSTGPPRRSLSTDPPPYKKPKLSWRHESTHHQPTQWISASAFSHPTKQHLEDPRRPPAKEPTYAHGIVWAQEQSATSMWTPVLVTNRPLWEMINDKRQRDLRDCHVYSFQDCAFHTWTARVRPWKSSKAMKYSMLLREAGMQAVVDDAEDYYAMFERLECVFSLSQEVQRVSSM
ncbi:hypothetical protein, variant 1 [Aphanomyces astaci]|uniref:PWWP domain-containing protein n=1 Tax=Aphanomyces astaci TaxID=112090 RepID=W4H659_APHAT|nr:hypothetical protein, variant 1 [Aphanomyces astaci]ETV86774.1 hypothetical protein, variant 1 [Aphanomyces astaci]|eukprot:XP_009823574.1 hypothetical protein, variant 1 [Aphanomyces astaci]